MADQPKTIAYTCPYVPPEWIAAHGLMPRRLIPLPMEGPPAIPRIEGLCPYARAFANDLAASRDIDGVVVTTACDQMRRIFDLMVRRIDMPAFLLNVPSTWQTPAAERLYLDELKRLGRFLVRLGGHTPDNRALASAMLGYEAMRETAIVDCSPASGAASGEAESPLARYAGELRVLMSAYGASNRQGVPIDVIGGPLMQRDRVLFDIISECGGRVVCDATETGERTLARNFDSTRLRTNPLSELARTYFGIPDPFRRPNSEFYQWLKAPRVARGIVLHHYVWCDKWHAEFARLKEQIKEPILRLDSEGEGEMNSPRVRNRIHAFLETLR